MNQAVRRSATAVMLAILFAAGTVAAASSGVSDLEKAKAAARPRVFAEGGPDLGRNDAAGGPDDYGYIFKDETDSGGPTYNWIDTVGATSLDITGDDTFCMVALPFAFSFYGTTYNYCYPSTNGQVGLGSGIKAYSNYALPTTNLPANHLCPYWDDLYVEGDSINVLYKTVGTAPNRQFVVIWDSVRTLSGSYRLVFEAILSESDNSITYQYRYLDSMARGQSATVGEQQAQAGNYYLQYSYNTSSLIDGRAIKFWRPEYAKDVGTRRIVTPNGLYLMDTIYPAAVIKNYGTADQSNFGVKLDIGTGYTSTVNVAGPLAPGDTLVVNTFTPWVPTVMGQYAVTCSTRLDGDLFTTNDRATATATIVGLLEHFDPTNGGYAPVPGSGHWVWREPAFPRPAPPSPKVWTIPDSGAYLAYESSYVASCKYVATADTPRVMFQHWLYCEPNFDGGNLSYSTDNGSTWTVIFPDGTRPYDSLRSGEWGYTATISWELAVFRVPVQQGSAFKLRWKFMTDLSVQYEGGWMIDDFAGIGIARPPDDVGVVQIVAPGDTVRVGDTVAPRAVVQNFGSTEKTFLVRFSVGDDYQDTASLTLAAGLTDTVRFEDWTAESLGTFSVTCSTELAGDVDPANDAVHDSVAVVPFVAVAEPPGRPGVFSLDNALPNPFTGSTVVRFGVARAGQTNVSIYSAAGTLVRVLLSPSSLVPGTYSLAWDGRDERGRAVGDGVYLMRMEAGDFTATRKLVLQR